MDAIVIPFAGPTAPQARTWFERLAAGAGGDGMELRHRLLQAVGNAASAGAIDRDTWRLVRAVHPFDRPTCRLLAHTLAASFFATRLRQQVDQAGSTLFRLQPTADACLPCKAASGRVYAIDDLDHLPPLHPGCSCSIVGA